MKRLLVVCCTALSLMTIGLAGCEKKMTSEKQEKVSGPGGTTTTTDTHKVESTGKNPPPNTSGETAK